MKTSQGFRIRALGHPDTRIGDKVIPKNIDYNLVGGLSNEVKEKLSSIKPYSIGQALRIEGITPAAVVILLGYLKKSA